jgi:hypothetical protein
VYPFSEGYLDELGDLAKCKLTCITNTTADRKVRGLRPDAYQQILHLADSTEQDNLIRHTDSLLSVVEEQFPFKSGRDFGMTMICFGSS